jgi:glycosyltransferase involved in cell wall biosynthesis
MTVSKSHSTELRAGTVRPGEISVIVATRGRPQMLAQFFDSLRETTARKDLASLWLYVDDDDKVTLEAIEKKSLPDPGLPVHWHVGPQTGGLGETHQALWKASGRSSQIYVTAVDDARFGTRSWDDIVRQTYDAYPDGVLLAFPHDPMTADQATLPIFGWGWLNTLESVYPGYFPYWFDDKWVDDIGRMVGRCVKLSVSLRPIGGKGRTKRMRNMPFWTRFFHLTLYERKESARKLIAAMHPADEAGRTAAFAQLEQVAARLEKEKESFSDVYCVFQEERHTELTAEERQQFNPRYFRQEALAVARLLSHARELLDAKKFEEAMLYLDAVQLSDMKVRQGYALMAECLRGLGRISEAERIASEAEAAWPQMNPLRRCFRFLGMVANDGKRMLVGLTHKGKTSG